MWASARSPVTRSFCGKATICSSAHACLSFAGVAKRGVEPGGCSTSSAEFLAIWAASSRASSPASWRLRRMISLAAPSFHQ